MKKFLTLDYDRKFKRDKFSCGQTTLDNYIQRQATKESKQGLSRVYVLIQQDELVAYYTLSAGELPVDAIPEGLLKQLPQGYIGYPAILIGRLAVTLSLKGQGVGGALLVDAIERCVESAEKIGTAVIMVDPIDENAGEFYAKYGFQSLPDANRMILKIDHVLKAELAKYH